jgi:hypothetical protein
MLMRDRHRERFEYHRLLDQLRQGDVLVVWKLPMKLLSLAIRFLGFPRFRERA